MLLNRNEVLAIRKGTRLNKGPLATLTFCAIIIIFIGINGVHGEKIMRNRSDGNK